MSAECGRGFHTGSGSPHRVGHRSPSIDCSCGIYATRDVDRAVQIADCATARFRDCLGRPVLGAALGGVIVGRGRRVRERWRASYAYPAQIHVLAPSYGRRAPVVSENELVADLGACGVPADALDTRSSLDLRQRLAGERAA